DGNPLTYSWTQLIPSFSVGSFSSTSSANPVWTAPNVTANGIYTLRVTVTDGQGGTARGDVIVTVNKVNQPPNVGATINVPATVPLYTYVQTIWNGACTSCHGTSGGLSLGGSTSYSNLVNVATSNSACSTLKRVLPNDPDNSALIRKMEGTTCGGRMP